MNSNSNHTLVWIDKSLIKYNGKYQTNNNRTSETITSHGIADLLFNYMVSVHRRNDEDFHGSVFRSVEMRPWAMCVLWRTLTNSGLIGTPERHTPREIIIIPSSLLQYVVNSNVKHRVPENPHHFFVRVSNNP
jgi:hypothetical protein